jgi:hypothetical protein
MFSPGVLRLMSRAIFYSPFETVSGRWRRINSLHRLANSAGPLNPNEFGWTSSSQGSPISSRASQNAAALLFELGAVDVR